MDLCRICLTNKTHKKISELNMDINENTNYSQDVMMFCLGIQVENDPKISTKLCTKCYKKIILFYEFKVLALKNNAFLKTVSENTFYENDSYNGKDVVKIEKDSLDDANDDTTDVSKEILVKVKDEFEKEVKEEDSFREFDSDDEVLSVIKIIKHENLSVESSKENAPVKKKRGRPKIRAKKEKPTSTLQICDTCGKPVKNLKDHLEIHNANRKTISCKMCDKTFKTKGAKLRHYKIKHLGIKGHCNICGKDVVALKQHTMLAHNREALRFACSMCDQRFISESSLKAHMITHCKARPYECDICHNNYRSKLGLDQHKRQVHEKEKSHLCQFCSKSFFKKYHLQVHIRSHTNEKPYKCPDCDKSFGTGCMLKNHRLIHSDVKAFACTECGMRFSRPGYLRNHMISHTKEKRYPCRYCAMRFGRSDHRKRHEYTAHEKHSMPAMPAMPSMPSMPSADT